MSLLFQHFFNKIDSSIAGCFFSDQASSVVGIFPGEDAGFRSIAKTFILSEHITDFPFSDADIACWHIDIRTNMAREFCHETLAETHDFTIRFSFWIEIRTAFTAADWQTG